LPATGAPSRQQTAENLTYSGTPGHAGGFRRSRNSDESVTRANKLKTEAGSGQAGTLPFAVAAPHIGNTLPTDVVAASSLSTFRRPLKRFLFKQSYPGIIY